MRSSPALLALLAALAGGEAAAQSTLNVVTIPPGAGVVIPPRGAGPRLVARPPSAVPLPGPVTLPDTGIGLAAPGLAALILPAVAAAVLGGTAAAGGTRGGSTSGPARTR